MFPTQVPEPEVKKIWQQACADLKQKLSPAVYNTWILANPLTQLENISDDHVGAVISSPTAFHSTNLKKNLHLHLKQSLEAVVGKSCDISYVVGSQTSYQQPKSNQAFQRIEVVPSMSSGSTPTPTSNSFPIQPTTSTQSPRVEDLFSEHTMQSASQDRLLAVTRSIGLRPDFTFETFAVSTTNEMAHAAASAVSNRPGDSYNPLFLYGSVGVGKTHLMHAIGNNILKQNPNAKIIYCTGEEFTNDIVSAIQTKKASHFKQRFRNCQVLLIDDVQFLAGKNAVQEEFFHTFNALIKQTSQIVLTSDRPPHEINLLEDRLRSRFEAGLMIDIGQPSFELRTAILLVKAKAARVPIPIELAKMIASKVESARKIEGMITSIRSEVELKGREINAQLIEDILKTEIQTKRPRIKAKPNDIIKTVANHYHLKQSALKGNRRQQELVTARHIAMYLLKKELSLSLVEIGRWFSNRDHTSVLHAINKIDDLLQSDEMIQQDISALRTTLLATI